MRSSHPLPCALMIPSPFSPGASFVLCVCVWGGGSCCQLLSMLVYYHLGLAMVMPAPGRGWLVEHWKGYGSWQRKLWDDSCGLLILYVHFIPYAPPHLVPWSMSSCQTFHHKPSEIPVPLVTTTTTISIRPCFALRGLDIGNNGN